MNASRLKVFTTFGTVLYYDGATDCVMHGPIEAVPDNVMLSADGGVARLIFSGQSRDITMSCDQSGKLRLMRTADSMNSQSAGFSIVNSSAGSIGLKWHNAFLSAQPDGAISFSREWCREWEQFRATPTAQGSRRGSTRRTFYVDLNYGYGFKKLDAVRTAFDMPLLYIWAPPYTPYSGGAMALHLLCHFLNHLGVESYINCHGPSGILSTPQLTPELARAHSSRGRLPICVYPEIVIGNAMAGTRVARFLLNRPGQRGSQEEKDLSAFWQSKQREREYLISFAEEFKLEKLKSKTLFIPIVDDKNFYKPVSASGRQGFLVYSHRVRVTPEMVPGWANPHVVIDWQKRRTPEELGDLYRTSEGLILFERTGAQLEAAMCGCPIVAVPGYGLENIPMRGLFGNDGVGWGTDLSELEWASQSIARFQSRYEAVCATFLDDLADLVGDMMSFFDRGRPD
jgi:hypothetical protein